MDPCQDQAALFHKRLAVGPKSNRCLLHAVREVGSSFLCCGNKDLCLVSKPIGYHYPRQSLHSAQAVLLRPRVVDIHWHHGVVPLQMCGVDRLRIGSGHRCGGADRCCARGLDCFGSNLNMDQAARTSHLSPDHQAEGHQSRHWVFQEQDHLGLSSCCLHRGHLDRSNHQQVQQRNWHMGQRLQRHELVGHHYLLQRGSSQTAALEAPVGLLGDQVVVPHCNLEESHLMALEAHHSSRCHLVAPLHSSLLTVAHRMVHSQVAVGIQQVGIQAAGNHPTVSTQVGILVGIRHKVLVGMARSSRPVVGMHPVVADHILPLKGKAEEGPFLWIFCGSALLLLVVSNHSAQLRPCVSSQKV